MTIIIKSFSTGYKPLRRNTVKIVYKEIFSGGALCFWGVWYLQSIEINFLDNDLYMNKCTVKSHKVIQKLFSRDPNSSIRKNRDEIYISVSCTTASFIEMAYRPKSVNNIHQILRLVWVV